MAEAALTSRELVSELGRLEAFPDALRRRTQGVSWMLWGILLTGAFFTYNYLGVVHEAYGIGMWPFLVAWVPWALVGAVATWALWKANGLRAAAAPVTARRMALTFALLATLVFAFFVAYHYSGIWRHVPLVAPAVMLVMFAFAAFVIAATRLGIGDPTDRILWVLGGVILLLTAVATSAAIGTDQTAALRVFAWLGPAATLTVYFGNGLYLCLRG